MPSSWVRTPRASSRLTYVRFVRSRDPSVIGRCERERAIQQPSVEEDLLVAVDVRVDDELELGVPAERQDRAEGAAGLCLCGLRVGEAGVAAILESLDGLKVGRWVGESR